ncbi:MAG: NTP transferase domain-containing protein [Gemmatimonadetes bacterium]|nr:NTP transferase domain-containing protein [Gemmatimonadota bacterium]NIQ59801.1 NTP transferase domain-containing protein [Gemmatimonadota bacterium]NIU80004.1 NTP transferase domain-containing protein [Gammaproteobacteria bacterium]NIX48449.1 NTP transferase domain-containing protein [Gemmatimonadota bacterium]NIY12883.1 NTP transferase domain-containing protein [Gemmatimonadota bacterium]
MATGDRDPRVGGVVLAAGRSARMGEAKALLDVGGRTFVARSSPRPWRPWLMAAARPWWSWRRTRPYGRPRRRSGRTRR